MIDPTHELSVTKQAKLLGIARSTVYYKPKAISETTSEARAGLTQYIRFYNEMRGHRALSGQTPNDVYFTDPLAAKAA